MSYEHSEAFKENSQLAAYSCNGGQGMGSEELAKQVSDFPGCHKKGAAFNNANCRSWELQLKEGAFVQDDRGSELSP